MNEPTPRPRRKANAKAAKNTFTTKSGATIKLNQSMGERRRANKEAKARKKAAYLSTLPKERWKRVLYRMHPKRVAKYWFSREGAIMALKITGIGLVVVFLLVVGLFAYFRKDLPKIKDLAGSNLGGSVTYYDRTGQTVLWQDYDAVKRVPVPGDQISKYMAQATVAIEDKDYYNHGAFDVRGIVRAGVNDLKGGSRQGGSTITQQLVKLDQDWTNDRTISRKVKELILAVELEREYSKDDILTGYLNIAPYGGVDYGVQAASRDYFAVDAKDLTLAQAAMLASIPKAPGAYSPYNSPQWNPAVTGDVFNKEGLLGRQQYVLDQMAKQGYITQAQANEAKKVDVLAQVKPLTPRYAGIKAPYFVLTAKQELENKFGSALVQRGGWKVITTVDMTLQTKAEELVASNRANVLRLTGGVADEQATVLEDVPTGQIVALVGGVDSADFANGNQNNYASGILIPPGSTFKPYDYATFIENNNNVGAGSVLYDTKGALPGYPNTCDHNPNTKGAAPCATGTYPAAYDYDNQFPGPITLRYALGGSRNVPAMKAMLSAVPNDKSTGKVNSINKTIATASAMMSNTYLESQGKKTYNCYADETLKTPNQCYTSAAIGDGAYLHLDDHVNGYATLGRMGSAIPRTYLLSVTNPTGKSLLKWTQPQAKQVIKPDTAYIVNDMAADPNASYLPGSCSANTCTVNYKFHRYNGWHFAIKTGTTNDGYDGLMGSWSSKYAVMTWVGNNMRNVSLTSRGASMESLTMPITRGLMQAAHANLPASNWTKPADVKTAQAFVVRSKVSRLFEVVPSPSTDLYPSWYTGKVASNTSNQAIDKVSGKLASSCTPELAKQTSANSNAASWNADQWMGGSPSGGSSSSNSTPQESDDIHNCSDTQPTITITAVNGTAATGSSSPTCPATGVCDIKVLVQQGTYNLTDSSRPNYPGTINLTIDGQVVQSLPVSDSGNYDFSYTPSSSGGSVQITVQVIDSVLYSGTDVKTITIGSTTVSRGPGSEDNSNNGNRGRRSLLTSGTN